MNPSREVAKFAISCQFFVKENKNKKLGIRTAMD
jgi:hypothetical protein